jgi:hypothetical protein
LRELKISLWWEFWNQFTVLEKTNIKKMIDWELNKTNQRRNILWVVWSIL